MSVEIKIRIRKTAMTIFQNKQFIFFLKMITSRSSFFISLPILSVFSFLKKMQGAKLKKYLTTEVKKKGLYVLVLRKNQKELRKFYKEGLFSIPMETPISTDFNVHGKCIYLMVNKPTKSDIKRFSNYDFFKNGLKVYLLKIEGNDISDALLEDLRFLHLDRVFVIDKELTVKAKVTSLKLNKVSSENRFMKHFAFNFSIHIIRLFATRLSLVLLLLISFKLVILNENLAEFVLNYQFLHEFLQSKIDIYLSEDPFRFLM